MHMRINKKMANVICKNEVDELETQLKEETKLSLFNKNGVICTIKDLAERIDLLL